jgi:heme oxygenase
MATTIMQRLRDETRAQHVATEAIPFSAAILSGTLSRSAYAGQLAAYLPVHRAIENAIADRRHPALARVWTDDMARAPLLEADLDQLGATDDDVRLARPEAEEMAGWIEGLAGTQPIAILGVVYVLEGSSLGGALLRGHLARAFGLTDAGLRYYSPYGVGPKPHWTAFSERMNAAVNDGADADAIVAAAVETFVRIGRILSALTSTRAAVVG